MLTCAAVVGVLIALAGAPVPSEVAPPSNANEPAAVAPARNANGNTGSVDTSALSFALDVPRIVLGDTATASILVRARAKDGSPLDASEPRLVVNVGTLSALEHLAPGNWKATYTPPKEGPPQVAIVMAALNAGEHNPDAVGFFTIPLWGKGSVAVKTKPSTDVTLKAGAAHFGPVKADATGKAEVPLVLPPGVKSASTKAEDEAGNTAERTIDLGVPPFLRVAVIALDEIAVAAGSARLFAVAVDENGVPLKTAPIAAKASDGSVDVATADVVPGLRGLTLHAPKIAKTKPVDVDVSLEKAPGTAKATVAVVVGPPSSATIQLSRENMSDDDDDRNVEVAVRLFDAGGNPLPTQAGLIHVDIGSVFKVRSTGAPDFIRTFTWSIPQGTTQKRATVSVRAPPGMTPANASDAAKSQDIATAGFDLLPPRPKKVVFDPFDFVVANGENGVDLVVRARDRNGFPASPAGTQLAVVPQAAGHVSLPEDVAAEKVDENGDIVGAPPPANASDTVARRHRRRVTDLGAGVRVHFVPTAVAKPSSAIVRAKLGDLTADAVVPLAPSPPQWVLRAGVAVASNYGALLSTGLDLSALTRLWGPLYFGLDAGAQQSLLTLVHGVDQRSFPLLFEADFRPQLSPNVALLLGLAAGPVLSDLVPSAGAQHDLELAAGGQLVVGASMDLGDAPLDAFVRVGTAVYPFPGIALDRVGVPLGATLVVAWRFEP